MGKYVRKCKPLFDCQLSALEEPHRSALLLKGFSKALAVAVPKLGRVLSAAKLELGPLKLPVQL